MLYVILMDFCLKSNHSIKKFLIYVNRSIRIYQVHIKYGECSIRVYRSLLIFLAKHFLLSDEVECAKVTCHVVSCQEA